MASKQNQTKQKVPLRTSNPMSNPMQLLRKQGETWKGKQSLSKEGGSLGIRDEEYSPFITLNSPANIGQPTCV